MSVWDKSLINLQEQVYVLYVNANHEVISWRCMNTGNAGETLFNLKFVLSCALKCMATNIIIAHNHTSGKLHPTADDVRITDRLMNAAALIDILLLDHLIIKNTGYFSLMDTTNKKPL